MAPSEPNISEDLHNAATDAQTRRSKIYTAGRWIISKEYGHCIYLGGAKKGRHIEDNTSRVRLVFGNYQDHNEVELPRIDILPPARRGAVIEAMHILKGDQATSLVISSVSDIADILRSGDIVRIAELAHRLHKLPSRKKSPQYETALELIAGAVISNINTLHDVQRQPSSLQTYLTKMIFRLEAALDGDLQEMKVDNLLSFQGRFEDRINRLVDANAKRRQDAAIANDTVDHSKDEAGAGNRDNKNESGTARVAADPPQTNNIANDAPVRQVSTNTTVVPSPVIPSAYPKFPEGLRARNQFPYRDYRPIQRPQTGPDETPAEERFRPRTVLYPYQKRALLSTPAEPGHSKTGGWQQYSYRRDYSKPLP